MTAEPAELECVLSELREASAKVPVLVDAMLEGLRARIAALERTLAAVRSDVVRERGLKIDPNILLNVGDTLTDVFGMPVVSLQRIDDTCVQVAYVDNQTKLVGISQWVQRPDGRWKVCGDYGCQVNLVEAQAAVKVLEDVR